MKQSSKQSLVYSARVVLISPIQISNFMIKYLLFLIEKNIISPVQNTAPSVENSNDCCILTNLIYIKVSVMHARRVMYLVFIQRGVSLIIVMNVGPVIVGMQEILGLLGMLSKVFLNR